MECELSMVEYIIDGSHDGFYYNKKTQTIGIGKSLFNKLNSDELSTYISDAITHEYVHYLMHKYFDSVTSTLFDTIADKLRNINILNKIIPIGCEAHSKKIKREGFLCWLNQQHLNKDRVHNAFLLCNPTVQKDDPWIEIFGMHYLYRFVDEDQSKVLMFNKSVFVQFDYLKEL